MALGFLSFSPWFVLPVHAKPNGPAVFAPSRLHVAPTADAGTDQSAVVGALVTLDGSASSDGDGQTPLAYGWQQTGGPTVTLNDAANASATFTAPAAPTVITFTLTVTDTANEVSAPDEIVVTVNDSAITGLAASSSSPTLIGQATQFTATAITGSNITWLWDFGDGNSSVLQTPTHSYVQPGTYSAVVTATNEASVVSAATNVQVMNRAPVAALGAGTTLTVYVSEVGTLDASGSSDPDEPPPFEYAYIQTGGPEITLTDGAFNATTFTAPSTPATLNLLLTISDTYGLTDTATININVINRPITWIAALNSSPTALGATTYFTALSTGSNVTFVWDFGDGSPTAVDDYQTHTYAHYGIYNAVVTATNTQGVLTSGTIVKILNPVPVADAGADQSVPVSSTVTLNASGSSDPNNDVPLAYYWTQTGGPSVSLSDPTAATPSFIAPSTPSILTFTLQVTDSTGLPSDDVDTVVIYASDGTILGLNILVNEPTYLGAATALTAALGAGTNVAFAWSFGDGITGTGATPMHLYGNVGSYLVVLTASNGLGSASVARLITITNPAPIAQAGPDQDVYVNGTVVLSGALSSDLNDNTLQYDWVQLDGPAVGLINGIGPTPSFIAPAHPTTITWQLIVTDHFGLPSIADTVTIRVGDVPITGLRLDANTPMLLGNRTAFVASINSGSNVAYTWALGDGNIASGIAPTHTYTAIGLYKVIVTATNSLGTLTTFITVEVKNLAPIAQVSAATLQVRSGQLFSMSGSDSFDPNNNTPLTYRWQQTGGFTVTLNTPSSSSSNAIAPHVYRSTTLTFTLTVIDSAGAASVPGVVLVSVSPWQVHLPLLRR